MNTGLVAERAFQELGAKYVAEVSAAVMEGDLRRACDTANSAIANGIGHPVIFNARGLWLQQQGENAAALEAFQNALQLGGPNGVLLNAIGMCHLNLDQIPEARAAFERSAALEPATALTHYRIGLALAMGGDHQGARAKYKRVLELDPNHVEALSSLASIAAREGDGEAARSLAERALALEPRQPTARVALAQLDVSEKNFGSAETRLKHLLADGTLTADARPAVLGLLGDSLDGQKQYADAFAAYSQENHELRQLNRRRFAGNQGADAARNLVGYFERERAERWRAPDDGGHFADAPAQHVFLLGFMRSGTTLLEQVLASNPQITALEEKGLLNGLGAQFLTGPEPLESLAKISANEAMELRRHYWHRVRQFLPDIGGKVFVDKQPLNTTKLPIIAKLFPRAKILFALRDPRDVVFSCFRRHFKVNVTMYEFLSLEDSARFYSSIMRLEEVLRPLLGLDLLEHRYEAMVEDFEGRVRAVCDFIGVEWNDTMRTFNKSAPVMDLRSPSAIQVRKPLYGEGVGQWRRYHAQLQPIFPILKPWVEKFGYPLE